MDDTLLATVRGHIMMYVKYNYEYHLMTWHKMDDICDILLTALRRQRLRQHDRHMVLMYGI